MVVLTPSGRVSKTHSVLQISSEMYQGKLKTRTQALGQARSGSATLFLPFERLMHARTVVQYKAHVHGLRDNNKHALVAQRSSCLLKA